MYAPPSSTWVRGEAAARALAATGRALCVAQHLTSIIRMLRLLGCEAVCSGFRAANASLLSEAGVVLTGVPISSTVGEAMAWAGVAARA